MYPPDELTPQQEAILKAEDSIRDDLRGHLYLLCDDWPSDYLAELMELALYGKQETKLAQIEAKCLAWHDQMINKLAGV